jgi:phosphoserine phosphatase
MRPFPWKLVSIDIDGTLTLVHGWRRIAEAFGRTDQYELSNRRFFAHELDEDRHLDDLLDLAAGHTIPEVETVLAATPKLRGIREGIAQLKARGATVALLTHNPPYVCDWYARTYGFQDFEGTPGTSLEGGRLVRREPVHADKLGGARRLAARHAVPLDRMVHAGDGWSDAEVFREVGAGIAVNASLPEVERAASASVHTRAFADLVAAIGRVSPRP